MLPSPFWSETDSGVRTRRERRRGWTKGGRECPKRERGIRDRVRRRSFRLESVLEGRVPRSLLSNSLFSPVDGENHLLQNTLVCIRLSEYIMNTNESTTLPSKLINNGSYSPDVSAFGNKKLRTVIFKRLAVIFC